MSKLYTIKDIEALTNIKAHTIRIWEQRYQIVDPVRTEGNSRRYSEEQLKRIMNVAFLNHHGVKISHIALMDDIKMSEQVNLLSSETKEQKDDLLVEELIQAIIGQDQSKIDTIFSRSMSELGFEQFFELIIKPVFVKVGLLWQTGTIDITHEHFFSNIVRHKLVGAIESLPQANKETIFVLFLPNAEQHELSLLYYQYILRVHGFQVVYLGQSLPIKDLKNYNYSRRIHCLLSVVTSFVSQEELQNMVQEMSQTFSGKHLFFSGLQFTDKSISLPDDAHYFKGSADLKKLVEDFR